VAAKRIFLLIGHTAFREALACVLDEESELEVVSRPARWPLWETSTWTTT
jgi:hypothetical protein